jgi:hypothetical protein
MLRELLAYAEEPPSESTLRRDLRDGAPPGDAAWFIRVQEDAQWRRR